MPNRQVSVAPCVLHPRWLVDESMSATMRAGHHLHCWASSSTSHREHRQHAVFQSLRIESDPASKPITPNLFNTSINKWCEAECV
jgi:hypothetical protein